MTAIILPFIKPPQLRPGERPKRRADADRLRELAALETEIADYLDKPGTGSQDRTSQHEHMLTPKDALEGGYSSCIDFAKQGETNQLNG